MDIEKKVALKKLWMAGIKEEQLENIDIVLLPENFGDSAGDIYDAQDSIYLGKLLKATKIKCLNSYDLGLEAETVERRSNDIWLGQIYILNDVVLAIVTGVVGSLLANAISNWKKRKDVRAPAENVHANITIVRPEGNVEVNYIGDPETLIKLMKTLDKKHDGASGNQ